MTTVVTIPMKKNVVNTSALWTCGHAPILDIAYPKENYAMGNRTVQTERMKNRVRIICAQVWDAKLGAIRRPPVEYVCAHKGIN